MLAMLRALWQHAVRGLASALYHLGRARQRGLNDSPSPSDLESTARYYHLAATWGHAGAQCSLGGLYMTGTGVARDYAEAARLYRLAAAQGYASAQLNLGTLYNRGLGVARDPAEAARLFGLAAAQGLAGAQYHLGCHYAHGNGVARDAAEAVRLWRSAAEQGDAAGERACAAACCGGCGATRRLKTCARCQVARFCGPECVRTAWAEHKPHCTRWAAEAAEAR
jgi:TPR repeat protein